MRSSPKPAILAIGAALSFSQAMAAQGDAKAEPSGKKPVAKADAKKPKSDKKPGDKKAPEKKPADDEEMSIPIPEGEPQQVVKFPLYKGDGTLEMRFEVGVATKVDDKTVKMQKLRIETYKPDPQRPGKLVTDMNMDLPDAVLNPKTKDITSDTNVTIACEAFEVKGNAMKFNLDTRQGTLTGGVKMIIYDMDKLNGGAKPSVEFEPNKDKNK